MTSVVHAVNAYIPATHPGPISSNVPRPRPSSPSTTAATATFINTPGDATVRRRLWSTSATMKTTSGTATPEWCADVGMIPPTNPPNEWAASRQHDAWRLKKEKKKKKDPTQWKRPPKKKVQLQTGTTGLTILTRRETGNGIHVKREKIYWEENWERIKKRRSVQLVLTSSSSDIFFVFWEKKKTRWDISG
jgi:hypothetical protein